ncbi:MAG TPA: ATP-binding protein [Gemmatimonadales bacterium]|nr:ATP-binding protein [Gemmatimonadales bacterium]
MRLTTRLFASTSLLVAATVVALIFIADQILRQRFEDEVAAGLGREAQLVAALVPADSSGWPEAAIALGRRIGRRVTLIDSTGRVRGDAEFDRTSLAGLENHLTRPEVQAALQTGLGRAARLSASTNARQMYVAVRGGPPGITVVRVSATLASVDAEVRAVQRAVALAGLGALALAAVIAWAASRALVRPLVSLSRAARDIAAGQEPMFPDSRVHEVSQQILALQAMHEQLDRRFSDLRREREETATLIEAMADGVLGADPRGRIVTMNAAARRLLGYAPDAALPPLLELFHGKAARDLVRDVLDGQDVQQRELELDGRMLLVTGRPLPDGRSLLVLRDVTALRRLETVRRDFVANVSHELKTPLTSIAGYAETLATEAPTGTQMWQFAVTIENNARRMQHLVDGLLDLSRIESGSWRPEPRAVELELAVRDAWAAVAARAAVRGVALNIDIAADAPSATVDPDALRQILTNLFDNALRHTPAGGRITVRAARTEGTLTLSVSDTGSGIAAEHLPRIFERFYRADPGRARADGGSGLGLAIVKHLTEAHGGRVEAESTLGQGTTIRITLPQDQTAT